MTNFSDIFKDSFLSAFYSETIGTTAITTTLVLATIIAMYIFVVYRVLTRKTVYNKSFNIALVAMTILTTAIMLAMQSSLVISLGMVGALSIVRFRTAIKDPMDLVYLFWAIGVGIICGAGLAELSCIVSVLLTVVIILLDYLPVAKASMILVANADNYCAEQGIMDVVKKYSKINRVKSRSITNGKLEMLIEVRVKKESELIQTVANLPGVTYTALIAQDGEVTC